MLFNGLVKELPKENLEEFLHQIHTHITKIFIDMNIYVPDLIGAFFDIILQYKKYMFIDPELLFTLSKNSGLLSNGGLLLENQIALEDCEYQSKIGSGSQNNSDPQWVKLAYIYKELKLWDGVTGIFTRKMNLANDSIVQAIQNESAGLWQKAIKNYNDLLNSDPSVSRHIFYRDSFVKCYAHLSEWDKINTYIKEDVSFEKLWDADQNQENILPWFFMTGVYQTLETEKNTDLLHCLQNWMKEGYKSKYIQDKFSEELSVLSLIQDDITPSNYYLESYLLNFLKDWANINPLFTELRSNKLTNLQKTAEISKYLTFIQNLDETNYQQKLNNVLNYWQKQNSLNTQSFVTSELKTVYRRYLLDKLKNNYKKCCTDEEFVKLSCQADKLKLENYVSFITCALKSNNYYVAKKYINKCKNIISAQDTDGSKLQLQMCECLLMKSEQQEDGTQKLTELLRGWKHLHKLLQESEHKNSNQTLKTADMIHKFSYKMSDIISIDNNLLTVELQTGLSKILGRETLSEYCISVLRRGIEKEEQSGVKLPSKDLSDAYMNWITFMRQHTDSQKYEEDIIRCVFRAMKAGSEKARHLFPCILRIVEVNNSFSDLFKKEARSVPVWMFISWIPQLLGNLDTKSVNAVGKIIVKIAESYPNAIKFPYYLRKKRFSLNDQNASLVNKLDSLLLNPIIENFISSVSSVCNPVKYLEYYVFKMIMQKDDNSLNSAVSDFKSNVAVKVNNASNMPNSFCGLIFTRIAELYSDIVELLNKNNTTELRKKLIDIREKRIPSSKLKDYSPWLANYQSYEADFTFEIPGQYKGDEKPLPQYHIKLARFKEEVNFYLHIYL